MSNTGYDKKLASFNCDSELWEKFTQQCRKNGTTATAALTAFIFHYLDDSLTEKLIKNVDLTSPILPTINNLTLTKPFNQKN